MAVHSFNEHKVVIPMTVLEELDQIKDRRDKDVSREARIAIGNIDRILAEADTREIQEGVEIYSPVSSDASVSARQQTLALFPLSRALVPGVSLKLQLFEQRYLKLVRDCMESGSGFGVVGIRTGAEAQAGSEFFPYGCCVQIEDWDQLPNGLLGISVRADNRFSVLACEQHEDGLWVGQIKWLNDKRMLPVPSDYQGLKDLYDSLAAHAGQRVSSDEDAAELGWAIANLLPIANEDFAQLLAQDDPLERLEMLAAQIDELSLR